MADAFIHSDMDSDMCNQTIVKYRQLFVSLLELIECDGIGNGGFIKNRIVALMLSEV